MRESPPDIRQHSILYRYPAYVGGKVLLLAIIIIFAIFRRERDARTRAVITWRDRVLLVHNVAAYDDWTLPGGGRKASESYEQCLVREIEEELGLSCAIDELKFIKRFTPQEVGEPYGLVCFHVDLTGTATRRLVLSPEILRADWFAVDQLPPDVARIVHLALAQQ